MTHAEIATQAHAQRREYEAGANLRTIARRAGLPFQTVHARLRKVRARMRPRGPVSRRKRVRSKHGDAEGTTA